MKRLPQIEEEEQQEQPGEYSDIRLVPNSYLHKGMTKLSIVRETPDIFFGTVRKCDNTLSLVVDSLAHDSMCYSALYVIARPSVCRTVGSVKDG